MEPVTAALILAGIGAATDIGGKLWGSHKTSDYNDEMGAYNEKTKKDKEREQRRQALARAIGATPNFMPKPEELPPEEPDMMCPNLVSGIGNIMSTAGSMYAAGAGKAGSKAIPGKAGLLKGVK